jgi:hypothetical protein
MLPIIYSYSEACESLTDLDIIRTAQFFYISRKEKIIPWYSIFSYHFFIINNNIFIHDFEFKHITDDFFVKNNLLCNGKHIDLLINKHFTVLQLDKVIFIKNNYTNAGHSLANIMNTIYKLRDVNLCEYKIIITEDLIDCGNFLTSIIYLFFDKSQIIIVNDTTLVKFNETILIKDFSQKYSESHNFLFNKLKTISCITNSHGYHNIFLIKSSATRNTNPENKTLNNEYNDYFTEKGFHLILPEQFDVSTLFSIIYNAKNVIMSWGCCSYLNTTFVNENANILILCHKGYKNEYDTLETGEDILYSVWFPQICNKRLILYDMESDITNDIKNILDEKIHELIFAI